MPLVVGGESGTIPEGPRPHRLIHASRLLVLVAATAQLVVTRPGMAPRAFFSYPERRKTA